MDNSVVIGGWGWVVGRREEDLRGINGNGKYTNKNTWEKLCF